MKLERNINGCKINGMKEEIKQIWIDALTSGEYIQGSGELKKYDDTFCCLGVLVDLYSKETGLLPRDWKSFSFANEDMICLMPKVVADWAELPDEACQLDLEGERSLARMNDDNTPFSKIAQIIDERY